LNPKKRNPLLSKKLVGMIPALVAVEKNIKTVVVKVSGVDHG
jgi:hypothetical protein